MCGGRIRPPSVAALATRVRQHRRGGLRQHVRPAHAAFPPEDRSNGFVDNAQTEVVNSALVNSMMTAAEAIAAQSINTELAFMKSSLKCTLASTPTTANPDACAVQYINSRGATLFRRPLAAARTDLYASYMSGYQIHFRAPAPPHRVWRTSLRRSSKCPIFLPNGAWPTHRHDVVARTNNTMSEIASAISYMATGGPPDSTLTAAAAAGTLNTPDAIAAQYTRLLSSSQGHAQLEQFVLQSLAEDQIGTLGTTSGPVTPTIAAEMLTEAEDFVEEAVFDGSGTINELLTGNYTFANANLATFYGLPAVPSSAFTKVPLGPTSGRAGLLSQGAFLISSSQPGVVPLHRGHLIREEVLCEQLPSFTSVGLPAGFTPPPFSTPPHGTTTSQALTSEIVGPCLTCHHYFMPLGFGLQNFDPFGRYQTTENGGAVNPSGAIFESTSVNPSTGQMLAPASFTQTPFADYASVSPRPSPQTRGAASASPTTSSRTLPGVVQSSTSALSRQPKRLRPGHRASRSNSSS